MASGRRQHNEPGYELSRKLAKALRHDQSLPIQSDGFIFVDDLLTNQRFCSYTLEDIRQAVGQFQNQRFSLQKDGYTKKWKIKANQGHSVDVPELEHDEIKNASEIPVLIHLTTEQAWERIKHEGLKSMRRQEIHFSPGEEHIYRSKLPSCKIRIFVNAQKAMAGGIKFFRSQNNVILSRGNQNGAIPPQFFRRVELHKDGRITMLM